VVAVGDQQLGAGERGLDLADAAGVGHAPEAVAGAVLVGDVREGLALSGQQRRAGVQAEDRGQIRARRPREPEPVLLGARVGALVGADAAGPVVLDTDAAEEALAGQRPPVGPGVVLAQRPQRGLAIADHGALAAPGGEQLGGVRVGVSVPLGEVDLDDVVRRAAGQPGAVLGVDDVVGRGDQVAEVAGDRGVVVERA
jgi:hypothetical protein